MKTAGARAFAAHGYVDNAYRPPRLPFVSVVGPLSFNVEPEREVGRRASAPIRIPGHVIGRPRANTDAAPNNGTLRLRFDGQATVTLTGLPGGSFANAATGTAVAQAIHNGIQNARTNGQFTDSNGNPFTNQPLLAALQQAACRWDPDSRRLAILSDTGIPEFEHLSRVEILPLNGSAADALGFTPPDRAMDGRTHLHRLPPPRAITVDVQLNLWAANQQDMAALVEGLALIAPTRGNILTRPSLLVDDVAQGATTIRLLSQGEPTGADSLLHLEAPSGFSDRAGRTTLATTAGATAESNPTRLRFSGTGDVSGRLYATPLIPSPLFSTNPAPLGFAISLGLRLDAGGNDNDRIRVLTIDAAGTSVYRLDVVVDRVGPNTFGVIESSATVRRNGAPTTISTTLRVPIAQIQGTDFAQLHVVVDATAGAIFHTLNGEPQRHDVPAQVPVPPVTAPGSVTTAAPDMVLTCGTPAAANPVAFSLTHLHVICSPAGALDPNLRRSLVAAPQIQPGDPIVLVQSDDGFRPGGVRFQGMALSVTGDTVTLTKPVEGAWTRGRTLAFREENFFQQTSIKRRDDLLNHIYRACVDYRVSTFIEDPRALASAVLAEVTNVDVIALGGGRNRSGAPGVTAVITDGGGKLIRTIKPPEKPGA